MNCERTQDGKDLSEVKYGKALASPPLSGRSQNFFVFVFLGKGTRFAGGGAGGNRVSSHVVLSQVSWYTEISGRGQGTRLVMISSSNNEPVWIRLAAFKRKIKFNPIMSTEIGRVLQVLYTC